MNTQQIIALLKKKAEDAAGIPSRKEYGDLAELPVGEFVPYFVRFNMHH